MLRVLLSLVTAFAIFFTSSVYAHPGKTDANGGHTCRTNCEKWGLKYGEYHYHDKNGNIIRQTNKTIHPPAIRVNSKHVVKVIRVVDGDTIDVRFSNGATSRVRFIGVNTPETVHPQKPVEKYGKEASNYTKKRLTNQTVTLEFDVGVKDKYGRFLAYVWVGKELYNETLVKDGYARVMTIQPNVKYQQRFITAERKARQQKKGLWKL
ncbi:thermonuclease family protein [Anoxybacillus salavatliensis]|uniref:thermonuclease family protein n=1 Tax=Anoxybacillus TaxID=150247 RepID=UPI0013D4FD62|nr:MULTISPECIES: thermonuclease family protein [Anoxybacillus]MCQ5364630.1 thermonuclease family protein [Anoxybacillus gonensis]